MRTKLTLTAILALAITFTISCSDDKDDGGTAACSKIDNFKTSINGQNSGKVCIEISGVNNEIKQEIKEECEDEAKGEYYDSCPSGYAAKCTDLADNDHNIYKRTHYIYGDSFKGLNCNEYWDKH